MSTGWDVASAKAPGARVTGRRLALAFLSILLVFAGALSATLLALARMTTDLARLDRARCGRSCDEAKHHDRPHGRADDNVLFEIVDTSSMRAEIEIPETSRSCALSGHVEEERAVAA